MILIPEHLWLDNLELYSHTFESFIASELERETADLCGDEEPGEVDSFRKGWSIIFATPFRTSFLMTLMTVIEVHLDAVLRDLESRSSSPIRASDLHGSKIHCARKWMDAFAGFKSPDADAWARIQCLYKLRNRIVHGGGHEATEGKGKEQLTSLTTGIPGASVEHGAVRLDRAFTEYAFSTVSAFIGQLHKKREDRNLRPRVVGS